MTKGIHLNRDIKDLIMLVMDEKKKVINFCLNILGWAFPLIRTFFTINNFIGVSFFKKNSIKNGLQVPFHSFCFGIHFGFVPTRHFCKKKYCKTPMYQKVLNKKIIFNMSFLIEYTIFSFICVKYMPSGFRNGITLK